MKLPNRNKARLAERRVTAAKRQADAATLTPAQKLAKLDERLGPGIGAKRERVRLIGQLFQASIAKVYPTVQTLDGAKQAEGKTRASKSSKVQA